MVNFEFIKNKDKGYTSYNVKINGIEYEHTYASMSDGEINICLYSREIFNIVKNEKIYDLFKKNIKEIEIPLDIEYIPVTIEENDSAELFIKRNNNKYVIGCRFQYDSEFWERGYSIANMVHKIEDITNKNTKILFKIDDSDTTLNGFKLYKTVKFSDNILKNEINEFMKEVKEIFQVSKDFFEKSNTDAIYFEFDVDKSIQVPYKQYLVYFIQFLEDLGIESRSEIKDKVNKIMFQVIPKDKTIALKNIRACLEIYINLIDSKDIEVYEDYSNVAVMNLKFNINHLKNQLMLANTIIEQQQIAINLLKNVKVNIPDEKKDEIELFNGAIKVKEFEYKGLIINPAKILKLLKRRK